VKRPGLLTAAARYRACVPTEKANLTELDPNYFSEPLAAVDPEIADAIRNELERQQDTLEMIASENFVPQAVLEAVGSVMTNKYAEGYPGRRYYGGCEWVDVSEQLAIDRAKSLFDADYANVQPHSGAQANNAAYMALLEPGETILGMELAHGGHLTHGAKVNVSGKLYDVAAYQVRREDGLVDMDQVASLARERRPKVIVAGWSAYPRHLDFAAFRQVADEVGATLMVDMAHFAGLVAADEHPSPVPHAQVVTTTTHKTLCGPRAGMILCDEEHAQAIDKAVFPGQQGGPLQHVIAAKAVCLRIAASELFRERQRQTIANARALARTLKDGGLDVLTGGTDVHLVLVDLGMDGINGKEAEDRLAEVGITVNRNAIPFDQRPPMQASGLRIGTPALTTRGMTEDDMTEIGQVIVETLSPNFDDAKRGGLAERTRALMERYPLYSHLSAAV
jgi:glycine hydroxymethyltransferase